MKKFFFTLCLFSAVGAYAAEHLVLETPDTFFNEKKQASFEVNKKQGLAWVTLVITQHRRLGKHEQRIRKEFKEVVPGLSYDASSKTIMLDKEGALHECATVESRGRSIFRYDQITPKDCSLVIKRVRKAYDDGYRTRNRHMIQVHLVTK